MIYYPLSVLMMAGITEILVISTPADLSRFEDLLGSGGQWGLHFTYIEQPRPEGLAQAFILGADFIADDDVALILGDNIFYGTGLQMSLKQHTQIVGAGIFAHQVTDPERYGVVEFDSSGQAISLEEKPTRPKSSYAVPGLYFYDNSVVGVARALKPSARGELEITDLNRVYLDRGQLQVSIMGRGTAWFDTGTFGSLLQAGQFVQVVEERQGLMIGSPEEIAYRRGLITQDQLRALVEPLMNSGYGKVLLSLLDE